MAKYRLRTAHYLPEDKLLPGDLENEQFHGPERGTIVGDGTPYPIKWPTLEMVALDDEAEAMLEKERERITANNASMNPIEELSLDAYETEYVPGFNTRRKEAAADGAPVKRTVK
jgi:hypothetical protein